MLMTEFVSGGELLVTMMGIRIAMMTAAFMRRHRNRLGGFRLRGSPLTLTHTHSCIHTYLTGFGNITDTSSFVISTNSNPKTKEGEVSC